MILSLLLMLFLNGCNVKDANDDIFKYKNSYVGDHNAVIHITNQLLSSEHLKGHELKTKEEPYGIILNYEEYESEHQYKEIVIYNATFLFALVQNVDWITFSFEYNEYKVTKQDLQDWYGKVLSEFNNEEELDHFVQKQLEDEKNVNYFMTEVLNQ